VVAVDVGNSAIKLCLRAFEETEHNLRSAAEAVSDPPLTSDRGPTSDAALRVHSISLGRSDWERSVIDWVVDPAVCKAMDTGDLQWRIASVHRGATEQLCRAIEAAQPAAAIHRVTRRQVPMRVQVDCPDQLGVDRLLAAYAAQRKFGSPLIVVDAGSAVTVDWVDRQGDFCGGAILPGLALQLAALANGTDALPPIELRHAGALDRPARNTADAIRLGVVTGVVATIERLTEQFACTAAASNPEIGQLDPSLVLTGGDARLISSLLGCSHRLAENLVCRGLLDLPRSSFDATTPSDALKE
jgi:type III pantothenate kinase